jgi:DNA-binding response OmpR family regulator
MNSRSSPEPPESPPEPTGDFPALESVLPGSIQACIVIATSHSLHAQELQRLLHWLKDQIVVIRTKAEFWELMKTCPLGLLIVDRSFGGQDERGEDWCRHLRESVGYLTLTILLLGERADPQFIEAAFAVGATDYLTLPLQAAEVQNRVKTQLAPLSIQRRT